MPLAMSSRRYYDERPEKAVLGNYRPGHEPKSPPPLQDAETNRWDEVRENIQ
jgi:hypothetical protein